jgi:pimeloyl-ACP methyl ester carboxylesterase
MDASVKHHDGQHRRLNGFRCRQGLITVPTVVVHGTEDLMCHPSGGQATAEAIPGARLELIAGMGHDLPRGVWPQLLRAIAGNAPSAGQP